MNTLFNPSFNKNEKEKRLEIACVYCMFKDLHENIVTKSLAGFD